MRGLFLVLWCAVLIPLPAHAESEIRTVWGSRYEIPKPPEGELAEGLDPESAPLFHRNRERILKTAAAFLDTARPIVTAINQVKRPFSYLYEQRPWKKAGPNLGVDTDLGSAAEPMTPDRSSKAWVQNTLKHFDEALWMNTKVVSGANEFGFSLEAGGSTGAKLVNRGFYGIAGVGLTFLVDPKNKAVTVELFLDLESVRQALPGYIGGGLFGTGTLTAQIFDWSKPLRATCGQAVCLPGLVGSVTEDSLRAGVSKEIGLGFPGVAVFSSDALRVPVARVGLSPTFPLLVKTKTILGTACFIGFQKLFGRVRE